MCLDGGASVSDILKFSAINVVDVMKRNRVAGRVQWKLYLFLKSRVSLCVSVRQWVTKVCVCVCRGHEGPTVSVYLYTVRRYISFRLVANRCWLHRTVLRLLSLVTDTTRTSSPNAHRWMWYVIWRRRVYLQVALCCCLQEVSRRTHRNTNGLGNRTDDDDATAKR